MRVILLANGKLGALFAAKISGYLDIAACLVENYTKEWDSVEHINVIKYVHSGDILDLLLDKYAHDVVLSFNWNRRIKEKTLVKGNFYNLHPSLLPRNRGPIPLVFTILQGLKVSGVTLHVMDSTFDTGAIYQQEQFDIHPDDNYKLLSMKILRLAIRMTRAFAQEFPNVVLREQVGENGTYEGLEDLEKYTLSKHSLLSDLDLVHRAYDNIIPIRYDDEGRIALITKFSTKKSSDCILELNLKDGMIYVEEMKWRLV